MSRFRVPEIVIGFLVATIFWIAVAIVYPKYYDAESDATKSAPQITTEAETNKRIADYSEALDWLTAFLVVANLALWWTTWRSGIRQSKDMENAIAAAHDANEISRQGIVADQRAWVSIGDLRIESDLIFKKNMAGMMISVKVSNLGKTPALKVHTHMDMVYGYADVPTAIKILSENQKTVDQIHWTRTLLPGDSYRRKWGFTVEGDPSIDMIFPVIVGCTTYQISLDKSVHQTAFVFHLFECQAGQASEFVNGISPRKGLLPREQIGWDGGAGGFAD